MARPLPLLSSLLPINIISTAYIFVAALVVVSIFSIVTFLCASHSTQKEEAFSKKKLAISKKNLLESFNKANTISSKALLKMITWRKQVQHEEDEDYNDDIYEVEEAVWKKTIIKGEKCRPLDFSGKIDYDSEGKLLHDHRSIDEKKVLNQSH